MLRAVPSARPGPSCFVFLSGAASRTPSPALGAGILCPLSGEAPPRGSGTARQWHRAAVASRDHGLRGLPWAWPAWSAWGVVWRCSSRTSVCPSRPALGLAWRCLSRTSVCPPRLPAAAACSPPCATSACATSTLRMATALERSLQSAAPLVQVASWSLHLRAAGAQSPHPRKKKTKIPRRACSQLAHAPARPESVSLRAHSGARCLPLAAIGSRAMEKLWTLPSTRSKHTSTCGTANPAPLPLPFPLPLLRPTQHT